MRCGVAVVVVVVVVVFAVVVFVVVGVVLLWWCCCGVVVVRGGLWNCLQPKLIAIPMFRSPCKHTFQTKVQQHDAGMLNDGIGIFYVAVDQLLDWGMLNHGIGIFDVAVENLLDWGMLNRGIGIFGVAVDQLCLLQLEVNQCSAKVLPDFSLCGLAWSIRVSLVC